MLVRRGQRDRCPGASRGIAAILTAHVGNLRSNQRGVWCISANGSREAKPHLMLSLCSSPWSSQENSQRGQNVGEAQTEVPCATPCAKGQGRLKSPSCQLIQPGSPRHPSVCNGFALTGLTPELKGSFLPKSSWEEGGVLCGHLPSGTDFCKTLLWLCRLGSDQKGQLLGKG